MGETEAGKPNIRVRNSYKVLLVVVLVIVLCLASIYGTYRWQQNKIDNDYRRITQLTAQLETAKTQSQRPANTNTTTYTSQGGVTIKLYYPQSNTKVASPVAIVGEVPGNWSFEASFPVLLKDSQGNIVAQAPAQLLGDWMTDQLVPFSVKLTFTPAQSGDGIIVLQKDNPSGLAKNDDSVSIPVKF